ncbi:MAG: hypothetical protein ACRDGA_08025 [Bacteroidota bacterium]
MTLEDTIALTEEGVGDEVIMSQIKATNSYFELSKDDILELKRAEKARFHSHLRCDNITAFVPLKSALRMFMQGGLFS